MADQPPIHIFQNSIVRGEYEDIPFQWKPDYMRFKTYGMIIIMVIVSIAAIILTTVWFIIHSFEGLFFLIPTLPMIFIIIICIISLRAKWEDWPYIKMYENYLEVKHFKFIFIKSLKVNYTDIRDIEKYDGYSRPIRFIFDPVLFRHPTIHGLSFQMELYESIYQVDIGRRKILLDIDDIKKFKKIVKAGGGFKH